MIIIKLSNSVSVYKIIQVNYADYPLWTGRPETRRNCLNAVSGKLKAITRVFSGRKNRHLAFLQNADRMASTSVVEHKMQAPVLPHAEIRFGRSYGSCSLLLFKKKCRL